MIIKYQPPPHTFVPLVCGPSCVQDEGHPPREQCSPGPALREPYAQSPTAAPSPGQSSPGLFLMCA